MNIYGFLLGQGTGCGRHKLVPAERVLRWLAIHHDGVLQVLVQPPRGLYFVHQGTRQLTPFHDYTRCNLFENKFNCA